ncbi:hypothetical protein [Bradyrhizobium sp. LVM 105]|uniref:hypothetical protein n=1 Tax=Bradyrhizobium sp. LVM 105 TaxID=2341115 RepID=UPI000F80B14B|nr:hypothetical protein [Bradyrhizobium sp. LVM 105]
MEKESAPTFASLEEEEAALRARLDKIAQFKTLARELGVSLEATGLAVGRPVLGSPPLTITAPAASSFDGTLGDLIRCYRSNEQSPFHKLKYAVQNNYVGMLNKIAADFGAHRIADLSSDRVMQLYNQWAEGGKISMGHALAAKLRLLAGFGTTVLHDDDCTLFYARMRAMRFPVAEKRLVAMTAEHAEALRAKAHELGWGSIALAQAIQFELRLRQAQVIGEWVPMSDPAPSAITWGNEKWIRGLKWSDLDDKLILRFPVIDKRKRRKDMEIDLSSKMMVLEEMDKLPSIPSTGPMIICEATGRPYSNNEFRRKWRIAATKAGIPDNVRNADSVRAEGVQATKEEDQPTFSVVK